MVLGEFENVKYTNLNRIFFCILQENKIMKIKLFLILSTVFVFYTTYSQCNGRYQTEIFSSVSVATVNYSDVYTDAYHEMDIYTPDTDTVTDRPVVFYMHGGSFYGGDKSLTDCVDFCTSMAKRGYVAISLNYRLTNQVLLFLSNQEHQYGTVLQAVADAKAGIRYMKKDFATGNTLGIDTSAIYVGGYSAGAVLAIHLAYIDNISDLPTSPTDVQSLVTTAMGGTLEGDAGNIGYSSKIHGVYSFAGGINDLVWIDSNDEPLVSIHGDADATVSYNCAPGLGIQAVLTLCGAGEMHPVADSVGLYNDDTTYIGEDHNWAASGNSNPLFGLATDFVVDFLYSILPCNPLAGMQTHSNIDVNIYPNPSNSENINIQGSEIMKNIILYNSLNQMVYSSNINSINAILSTSKLSKGIYFIQIIDQKDNALVKKIVIQ